MTMSRLIRYQINPGVKLPEIPRKDDPPAPKNPLKPKDEVGPFLDGNWPRQFPGPDSKLPKPVIPPRQKEPDGGRAVQVEKNAPEERKAAPGRKPMEPPPRGVPPQMPGMPRVAPARPIPAPNNQPPGRGAAPAQQGPQAQQAGPNGWKEGKAIDMEGDDFLDVGKIAGLYDRRVGEFDQQDEATAVERGADKGTLAVLKGSDAQRAARTGPNGEAFTDDMLRAVDGWAQNIYKGRNRNPLEVKTAQELHKVYNAVQGINSRLADPNLPPDQRKTLENNLSGLRGTMRSYVHYATHNFIVRPGYARYGQDGSLEFKNPQGGFSRLPQGQDAAWFADQKKAYGWQAGEQFVPRQPQMPKVPKRDGAAWQDDNGNPIDQKNPAKIAQDVIGQRKAALGDDGPVLGNNGRPIIGALPPVQMRPGDNGAGGGVRNMPPKIDPRQRGGILPNADIDREEARLKLDIWEREQAKKRQGKIPPGMKVPDPNQPRDPAQLTPRQMQIIGAADMGGRMPPGVTPEEIAEARKARDRANWQNAQPGKVREKPKDPLAPPANEAPNRQKNDPLNDPNAGRQRIEKAEAKNLVDAIQGGEAKWHRNQIGEPWLQWTDPATGRTQSMSPGRVKQWLQDHPELGARIKIPTNTKELNQILQEQEAREKPKDRPASAPAPAQQPAAPAAKAGQWKQYDYGGNNKGWMYVLPDGSGISESEAAKRGIQRPPSKGEVQLSRRGKPLQFSQGAIRQAAQGLSGANVSKGSMDVMTRYLSDLAEHDPDRLGKMLTTNKVPERDQHYKWLDSLGEGSVDFLKYLAGGRPAVGGPATGSTMPPAISKLSKSILTNPMAYRRNLRDLHHELIEAGMYQPGTRPMWPDRERLMEVAGKLKHMGRHGEMDQYLQAVQKGQPMVDLEEQSSPQVAPPPQQAEEPAEPCHNCSGGLKEQVERLQARGIKLAIPKEMDCKPSANRLTPTIQPIRPMGPAQVPLIDD
jgi:hypothetical protein